MRFSSSAVFGAMLVIIILALCGCGDRSVRNQNSEEILAIRPSAAADMELDILEARAGPDGFPIVIVHLRNLTQDQILVSYAPNTVTIRCGDFVQRGPGETYGIRREILDGNSDLDFAPPTTGWSKTSKTGQVELMLPSQLPPGDYDLWAEFNSLDKNGWKLKTTHRNYIAR
jgi:hypothetical protein